MYLQDDPFAGIAIRDPSGAVAPSPVELTRRAIAELTASRAAERALRAGDQAPTFSLQDQGGNEVSSSSLLMRGPLVVVFYRGTWCPFSNLDLQALQHAMPAYREIGANLVAISPQTATSSQKAARAERLKFPTLTDSRNEVAAAFGLRFALPDYLVELYRELKYDLPQFNSDDSWTLPMPARFVIEPSGVIRFSEVDPDHTRRPAPLDLLPAVRASANWRGRLDLDDF